MTYEEVNSYFNNLKPFVPVPVKQGELLFDLKIVKKLAEKMNDPQDATLCIHITGTNGKGSTAAFLSSILKSAGYKTGTFSSPYLEERREQIQINGENISEEDFAEVAGEVIKKADSLPKGNDASEFEITTVAAFEYFARKKCDIAVIEVGLGGEYDATNIIKAPVLAVFTDISLDHRQVLGETVEEIARIKAGIIKDGTDVVAAVNKNSVLNILYEKCERSGGRFYKSCKPEDIKASLNSTEFAYCFGGNKKIFKIAISGVYQAFNAGLAITAAEVLKSKGFGISENDMRVGLYEVKRPARFEILRKKPCVIIDGSHNSAAIEALTSSLKDIFPKKKFTFILGVLADKEHEEMFTPLFDMGEKFHTITPNNPRALPGEKLADIFKSRGLFAEAHNSLEEAVSCAFSEADDEDIIVALGSLSYMGDIRKILKGKC